MKLTFGSGGTRITMDDTLDRIYRRAIERVAPGLLTRVELAIAEVYDEARQQWPVRTGRSRDGLQRHVTIAPDGARIVGSITNDVDYSRFIKARKLGGRSAFVELLRKPLRRRADELSTVLARQAASSLRGG